MPPQQPFVAYPVKTVLRAGQRVAQRVRARERPELSDGDFAAPRSPHHDFR